MTTISAATSMSSYSYSKSSTSASQDVLSCNTVSTKKSTKTQQLDEDGTNGAEKLMSQLMSLAMNGFASSSQQQDGGAEMDVAQLDSDGDGYVSKGEFVASRPSEVTEDQAGALFDSFDSEGSGSLSIDTLAETMSAQQSERADTQSPAADDDLESLLSDLDTDGDGQVSKAEFVAGRPSDVTEDQATTLFDSFDSEGAGSLSVDALIEAMSAQSSEGSEEASAADEDDDDDQFASLSDIDANGDGFVTLDEFMTGKPEDVTESQVSQLFDLLDTSSNGSWSARSTG